MYFKKENMKFELLFLKGEIVDVLNKTLSKKEVNMLKYLVIFNHSKKAF